MIIAFSFATGFQNTIAKKIFGFWGHVRVQHYQFGKVVISEETPIAKNDTVEQIIKNNDSIACYNSFATKSAVLENKKEIEGILIKGVNYLYNNNNIKPYLVAGRWLYFNDSVYAKEILLSTITANLIGAKLNDTVKAVFINSIDGTTTYRKLQVVGLYKTGVDDNDKHFALADIRLIQRINNWTNNEIGGYEVFIKNYNKSTEVAESLKLPIEWNATSIKEIYPSIFDWLAVMDTNRDIVFVIMSIVAIINLITCLLILVLERINMIGILKALGAKNTTIQSVFLYYASIISLMGVGIGFCVGVGLCLLQQYTHWFSLDEANYYVSYAPVEIVWLQVLAICFVTFLLCFMCLIFPTFLIKKVNPVQAISFK
jgi:lipoprotein-releasing system permease protein